MDVDETVCAKEVVIRIRHWRRRNSVVLRAPIKERVAEEAIPGLFVSDTDKEDFSGFST